MQFNIAERQLNKILRVFNATALLVICILFYQLRPLQIDSTIIQDRITNLNIYAEQRINIISANQDQLKNEMESSMVVLEKRIKLLQGYSQ